jgi:O-antigen ligase
MAARAKEVVIWFSLVILLIALIPLGATSEPARHIVIFLISTGFLAYAGAVATDTGVHGAAEQILAGTDLRALLVLPVFVALQSIWNLVSSGAAPVHATIQAATTLTGLALFYLLVRAAISDSRALHIVLGGMAFIGAMEALYGLLNLLSGNEYLLTWKRWIFFDSATGTLSSRNHFAFLMEMLLPVAAAFAVLFGNTGHRRPHHSSDTRSERGARVALVATLALACALALLFSHSRMGIVSFGTAAAYIILANRSCRPKGDEPATQGRIWLATSATLATVGVVLAIVIGLESVLSRFLRIESDFVTGRLPIWRAALEMFVEKPMLGQGWGTFQWLLPGHRPEPTGFFYTHAHNDYVEILAEGGIVSLAIVIGLLAILATRIRRTLAQSLSPTERTVILWLSIGITSVLFHSIADYGLRTPGVAFTFVALLAVFSRTTEEPRLMHVPRLQRRRRRRRRSETAS